MSKLQNHSSRFWEYFQWNNFFLVVTKVNASHFGFLLLLLNKLTTVLMNQTLILLRLDYGLIELLSCSDSRVSVWALQRTSQATTQGWRKAKSIKTSTCLPTTASKSFQLIFSSCNELCCLLVLLIFCWVTFPRILRIPHVPLDSCKQNHFQGSWVVPLRLLLIIVTLQMRVLKRWPSLREKCASCCQMIPIP